MKNLILFKFIILILGLYSTNLQASSQPIQYSDHLPSLERPHFFLKNGPRFAAVEPTLFITFTFASCAQFQFKAFVNPERSSVSVKVPKDQKDCAALPIKRQYVVQVSGHETLGKILLENLTLYDLN